MKTKLPEQRILVISSEFSNLPAFGFRQFSSPKEGYRANTSGAWIRSLIEEGADINIAMMEPSYLNVNNITQQIEEEFDRARILPKRGLWDDRIHYASDYTIRNFKRVYSFYGDENIKPSLAFQREVINNIIPRVQPDLIHCNDWVTGLITAGARELGIPCLFTMRNIQTAKTTLAEIEDRGIDAAYFWKNLHYDNMATSYEQTRNSNPVDLLTSGIYAAHFVNVLSPSFLQEIVDGKHAFLEPSIREAVTNKVKAKCADGILLPPDPSYNPAEDTNLERKFGRKDFIVGKKANKRFLQKEIGLIQDDQAPLFFWPSRLDSYERGCQLFADIFFKVITDYWDHNLQVVFVADGDYQSVFRDIINYHKFHKCAAICDFSEKLEHLAYGAADFTLLPSSFEPRGLLQMISTLYGTLPVTYNTGAVHDTITPLDVNKNIGNGFLFETFDANSLFCAVDQAMAFYNLPQNIKAEQIERIISESQVTFTYANTARQYVELYKKISQIQMAELRDGP